MSVMPKCYSFINYQDISAHGHIKEVVNGLNSIDKRYICQLISSVELPGSKYLFHGL